MKEKIAALEMLVLIKLALTECLLQARPCSQHFMWFYESPPSGSRVFLSPQKETLYLYQLLSSLSPQPLATTNLLYVSMDLPILDISDKWSDTLSGLLCLASSPQHDGFKVQPCCHLRQNFLLFYG